jgi:hypothetical protein
MERKEHLMLKLIPAIAVLCFTPALASEQRSGVDRLRDISVIYVADFGQTERAKTLRQEIIKEFAKSDHILVVDSAEKADAVLTATVKRGSKNVDRPITVFNDPQWRIGADVVATQEIIFRLDSRQNRTLWAARFDLGSFSNLNQTQAAHALANKVGGKFMKAVAKDSKAHR